MKKNTNSKKMRSTKKAFVALLATTVLAITPLQASAAGLLDGVVGGLLGGVTNTVGGVVGTVGTVAANPVGAVTGVVGGTVAVVGSVAANPVGTVQAVLDEPADTLTGVTDTITNPILPNGLKIETPVATLDLLNPGVDLNLLSGEDNGDAGTSGLLNAGVALNHHLTGSLSKIDASTKSLVLDYTGEGVLNLDLLKDLKVVYKMPEEFAPLLKDANFVKGLKASFDFPTLDVLGIKLLNNTGNFANQDIHVDTATNSIYVNVKGLLSVGLLTPSAYKVSLEIPLDTLPCALDNEYTFNAYASEAFVDVSVLETYSAALNIPVDFGKNNPCDNPTTPTDPEDPKDPATPGDKDTTGPKVDNNTKDQGGKLPITGTNLGNIALIGLLTLLAGFAVRFLGRKSVN